MLYYLSKASRLRRRVWEISSFDREDILFHGNMDEVIELIKTLTDFDMAVCYLPGPTRRRIFIDGDRCFEVFLWLGNHEYLIGQYYPQREGDIVRYKVDSGTCHWHKRVRKLGYKYPL